MDPYLENPWLWPDVHHELISEFRALLNERLRPKYVARVEERVYLSDDADPERALYVPDLRVSSRGTNGAPKTRARKGVKVDGADEPVTITTVTPDEVREARLEIRGAGGGEVVAVIEILSPTNKIAGSAGRDSFLTKRREVLGSPAHWCEIDLLRAGARPAFDALLDPHEYVVHVSPTDLRPKGHVWPVRLTDRLPVVAIPLRNGDPPVPLDLQAGLNAAYDRAAYDLSVDYTAPPVPPLPRDLTDWADKLLKRKKRR
jgi:hypothetical protein